MADSVGGRSVVKSGVLTIPRLTEEIRIEIEDRTLAIAFTQPQPGGEVTAEARVQKDGGIRLEIRNLDNPLGTTFHIQAGQLRGRPLFLTLYVLVANAGEYPASVTYTVSTG